MAEQAKRINDLIDVTATTFQDLLDVNTVVGAPITTISGFQIIPFSKITVAKNKAICLSPAVLVG